MLKKLYILVLILVVASASFAQSKRVDQHRILESADPVESSFYSDYQVAKNSQINKITVVGERYTFTEYDYATNSGTRPMVDFADFDGDGEMNPIVTAMVRGDSAATRYQFLWLGDPSGFTRYNPWSTIATIGWGTLQYARGGTEEGNIIMMAHQSSIGHVAKVEAASPTVPGEISTFGGNYPSFVYTQDGVIWATSVDHAIYKSVDGGVTFDSVTAIGVGDPNVTIVPATLEIPIQASDDGQVIAALGAWAAAGPGSGDSADIAYLYISEDAGATWSGRIIGKNGVYGQVSNRPNYAPFFANFGQGSINVDNNGVIHVGLNGYGVGIIGTDTTVVIPALYWNSTINTWLALTDEALEEHTDAGGTSMVDPRIYSGNAIGNAYPGTTVSDDGKVIFYIWQAPEYDGSGNFRIYPGDGGATSGPIAYTDLKAVYSTDSGTSWSDIITIAGDPSTMEQMPNLARRLDANLADGIGTVHMVFMVDAIPGAAIFGGNPAGQNGLTNDTEWRYHNYSFDIPTGVGDPSVSLNNYELAQNYPNPFNPSTKISFSLAKSTNVSLKVYDILGTEVATLVDGSLNAGPHQVTFDASNLASGLYIYTIKTAEFFSSKKMMLMK